ncbi:MAG: hypothetical protein KME60_29500 [Cyanomargarita calcarea GSE-NOS-MK-12-04C]|jgi:hypothetical protein|uniref:Uncharacterized protein n=1 Tax=Cyanomargarita calcarea GSE-NOS-MK-12-04C TaxID=2839659 RepID=A0A951QSP4_9CYAN|nr:hypothetical protein [Cyanomargarita calcarea GSE-NOS-MK-12-04C]
MIFRLSPLNIDILLWIVDNLISLVFYSNKIDTELGLPDKLKEISFEKYQEVRGRVLAFKTSVLFDENTELILTASDINALHLEVYLEYLKEPIINKTGSRLTCFDIQDDEVIMEEIFPLFVFKFKKHLYIQKGIKFTLQDGKVYESYRLISNFNKVVYSFNYKPVESYLSSNIIDFILGYKSEDIFTTKLLESKRIKNSKEADATVRKLKSIRVRDNKLILES